MKTMTCKDLGGACQEKFNAETFEEMGDKSKAHAMEMMKNGDKPHMQKMQEMMKLMQNPIEMKKWFEKKLKEFEALPEDSLFP